MDLLGSVVHLYKLASACDSGGQCCQDSQIDPSALMACYSSKSIGTPQQHVLRSYHVHHLVPARIFRCLRFITFVTASNARLAIRWRWYAFRNRTFTCQMHAAYPSALEDTRKVANMLHNPRVSWLWDNRTGSHQDHIEGFALNAVGLAEQMFGKEYHAAAELLLDRNPSLNAMLADTRAVIFAVDVEKYSWIQGYSEVRDYLPGAAA